MSNEQVRTRNEARFQIPKVLGRDRKGQPILRVGRLKCFYQGKQSDGRHLFSTDTRMVTVNTFYFSEEVFEQFKRAMDGAQVERDEKRNTQAAARGKITGFKKALRKYLNSQRKTRPHIFQPDEDFNSPFRRLRVELFEQNKVRCAMWRKNESQPAVGFTIGPVSISKEDAARYTVKILCGWSNVKSCDDLEVVDLDTPGNSVALRKAALKGLFIPGSSSITSVSLIGVDNG
jgi:hypothetical protein